MSRLYEDWKKSTENKLPKVFRKSQLSNADVTNNKQHQIVISIPLRGAEPVELTKSFLNVIEREYAVRYLEMIGVDPSRKNIEKILKEMPLDHCSIESQWRQPSDWLAETIKIIPHAKAKPQNDLPVSTQLANRLETQTITKELAREESKLTMAHFRKPEAVVAQEVETDTKIKINLDVQTIKHKFLMPFMDEGMKPIAEEGFEAAPEELMTSKVFQFSFESVNIAAAHIKEMMQPIEITVEEIASNLKHVVASFPKGMYPAISEAERASEYKAKKHTAVVKLFEGNLKQIDCENNARLIGIMAHFCYWTVFGHLHSIGISSEQQQQMFVTIIHLFNDKTSKLQRIFYKPLLILIVRIIVENVFVNAYKQFFSIPLQNQIANQKIQSVITRLFDPEGYYSRFSFLESGMDAFGLNTKNKSKMSSKYFSTSSMVKSLFPYPQHPRTRALFAKKEISEGRIENMVKTGAQIDGTMPLLPGKLNYYQQTEPWKTPDYLDIPSRAHLFMIALQKMKK